MPKKKRRTGKRSHASGSLGTGAGAGAGAGAGSHTAGLETTEHSVSAPPCFPPSTSGANKRKCTKRPAAALKVEKTQLYRGDCIFELGGFFAPHECAAWRAWAEKSGFKEVYEPPANCVPRGVPRDDNMFVVCDLGILRCPRFHEETPEIAHRNNGRMSWDDPVTAALVWERLKGFVPATLPGTSLRAVGCNPNLRLYRYRAGQRFGRHVDESVDGTDGSVSLFTVLVYLNGDTDDAPLKGGHTVFYGEGRKSKQEVLRVAPAEGKALLHGHGSRCLLHEGAEVTEGVKYLFRTDVMYAAV